MPGRAVTTVVKSVRTLLEVGTAAGLPDGQLLERYRLRRDDAAEAAFGALVERHGPMVLRVCRGVLHDSHDAEDAFQATFLILARKAGAIRKRDSVASWLFGVARHVAGRARAQRQRRAIHEGQGGTMGQEYARSSDLPLELVPEVQEEIDRLPERYRAPIVLCYLEGLTQEETASQLRLPASTVRVRLMRARARLRERLIRRGLAPASLAGLSASRAESAIPASLADKTIKAAVHLALGKAAGVSAPVAALVKGVIKAMFLTKLKLGAALLAALTLASVVMLAALAAPVPTEQEQAVAERRAAGPASKTTGDGPEVTVVTVGRSRWERTTNPSGKVIAAQSADLYPRISGYVSNLPVDIGSRVKRGDLVAELSDPELSVGVEKARAEVERARARVRKAEASIKVSDAATGAEEAKVQVASSAVAEAESRAQTPKLQLDRTQEAAKRGHPDKTLVERTAAQYAPFQAAVVTARSQLLAAKAVTAETRAKTDEARADLAEATSNLRIAESGLHSAEIAAAYTRIESPLDGIVTHRNCHLGELVRSPNAVNVIPIVTIVETKKLRFVVNVPESVVPLLDVGDQAKVRIDGLGVPTVYHGQIARTAYAVDPNDGTVRAEIDLTNSDGRLRPGQSGNVTIVLVNRENVLMIPSSAIIELDADGTLACYRVVAGRAVRSQIRVGDGDGTRAEVLEGLKEGDVVVTLPAPGMLDGQAVTIKGDGQKPAAR
jgi:HlyD family secretion protein